MILRLLAAILLSAIAAIAGDQQSWERQTWQTDSGLPQNTVHAVLQGADGYLWIATEGGLARFDGYQFHLYTTDTSPGLPSNDVRALASDRGGALWVATAGGLVRMVGTDVKTFGVEAGLPSLNITNVYGGSGGQIVAETSAGDAVWDELRFRATSGRGAPPALNLNALPISADDPVRRAGILCYTRDREGNWWIGTETAGLTVLRPARFRVLGQRGGLAEDDIRSVAEAPDGSLWIGTAHSGVNRLRGETISHFSTADGLSSDVVIALGQTPSGDMAVGTPDGLNIVNAKGEVAVLTSADGLADDFIRSLSSDAATLYAGTRRGLTAISANRFRTYTEADGLGSDLVGATLPVPDGSLWIATRHGLSRLRQGAIHNYTTLDGLPSDVITSLYRDADGALWIGTGGGSLACFRDGKFYRFAPSAQLPATIYGIAGDTEGSLWFSSDSGLYRASRNALLAGKAEAVMYGTADGLRVNGGSAGGHPALLTARDGTLWFATPRGLASVTREGARLNSVPPPVVVESVRIDDDEVPPGPVLTVPPGRKRFAFEYAGISFLAPQKVRYRYRLDGFDKSWIDAGTRRVAFYTNVPPGQYRFHVQARNNDGVWNRTGASVGLNLQPRFYQTVLFYAAAVALLALLVYGAYRWRVRQVALRYNVVLAERNRIAREIHDTLAQGFAALSVQLELMAKLMDVSAEAAKAHKPPDAASDERRISADLAASGESVVRNLVKEQLKEARKLVRSSLSEARRSIWELRAEPGAEPDFATRLGSLTRRGANQPGANVRLDIQGALRPLDAKVESELVRIAEEAVRNAQRHGEARDIDIVLAFTGKRVRLSIADNGKGFDTAARPTAKQGHFGVDGMRERAQSIGAKFQIVSTPGNGTSVTVDVDA